MCNKSIGSDGAWRARAGNWLDRTAWVACGLLVVVGTARAVTDDPTPDPIPIAYCTDSGSCCQGYADPHSIACCLIDQPKTYSDGKITEGTEGITQGTYGGCTPQGNYTTCSGVQACCFADLTCSSADGRCCDDLGGVPGGAGSSCSTTVACCLPDGTCADMPPSCCTIAGGSPGATGSACSGTMGVCCDGVSSAETDQVCCAGDWQGDGTVCDSDNILDEDNDNDGICDACDNCLWVPNVSQSDSDSDGVGNACDNCPDAANPPCDQPAGCDCNGDGDVSDPGDALEGDQCDRDFDSFGDACDNCPDDANEPQDDGDEDGVGDVCDNCPFDENVDQADADGDGVGDVCDNCPVANPACDLPGGCDCNEDGDVTDPGDAALGEQCDRDGDGIGDACDDCADDPLNDPDNDDVCNDIDNCPDVANTGQDNCDAWSGDTLGDACDDDIDGDGILNDADACDYSNQQLVEWDTLFPQYNLIHRTAGHPFLGGSRLDVDGDCDVDATDVGLVNAFHDETPGCGSGVVHLEQLCTSP